MRMPALTKEDAAEVIRTSYDCGINFFDHATCYGAGEAEVRFSEAFSLTGLKREDIYILFHPIIHIHNHPLGQQKDNRDP